MLPVVTLRLNIALFFLAGHLPLLGRSETVTVMD